ncbi:hypothetical protein [Nitrosopumilus sp.]|uniref:hypothetical protein n=1 Tax=Nitrosopumilus sp. TaxID=2024843 RepID=UPI003B58DB1F
MKKVLALLLVLAIASASPAYGHKLISHDDSHRSLDSALHIPDHKISWAIYENLGADEAKFYTFDAKKGDSFYASIVIPKISGLEEYSPSLLLMSDEETISNSVDSDSLEKFHFKTQKSLYEGKFPGNEFYEPFGQVTYWERQEIKTVLPYDGKYFVVVMDEKNQSGKYSLAIGTIEDFSGADLFTILPKAWIETKLFVNDYLSIAIFFSIISIILIIPIYFIIHKRKE